MVHPVRGSGKRTMKKLILLSFCASALVLAVLAQSVPNGIPTPTEAQWPAGIFNYVVQTGTNGTISNPGRQGYAAIGANSTSLVVTNAGVTTNAFIAANLFVSTATTAGDQTNNWVTAVTPASGAFTVRLRQPPGSNAVVRWLILNY